MPRSLRIILIALLAAGLALLYPNNISTLYGLALVSTTAFLNLLISQYHASYLKVVLQLLVVLLFSVLILIKLAGIHYGITWPNLVILSLTIALVWILLHTNEMALSMFWELATLVATLLVAVLWLYFYGTTAIPIGNTPAERQFKRIVQAIGTTNQEHVKQELETRFGSNTSDTWKNSLGNVIPATGAWPLNIFFPKFNDAGNALAYGLWGQQVDSLLIADATQSLQPLLGCRIAIRNLLLPAPIAEQYTPFFQAEDFGGSSDAFLGLTDKIYSWQPDLIKSRGGCDTKPKTTETLVSWVEKCFGPIGRKFQDDQDLQQIKIFAQACGAVQFVDK